jgi:transcription antitermination factor NusG
MESWYALHVHSNTESLVRDKLAICGIEGFYPHLAGKSRDGLRETELKFMPGYVFGRFAIEEKTPVVAINQVVSILGFGRHAIAIPDSEIAAVKLIVSFPSLAPEPCAYVAEGDRVRVRGGPLAGLEGYVCYMKNRTRVIVSVTMLARSISAEVDAVTLEMLEPAVKEPAALVLHA